MWQARNPSIFLPHELVSDFWQDFAATYLMSLAGFEGYSQGGA
jgi:hypothetical protein